MEILGYDILNLFTLENLLVLVLGTFVGMVIGALPGMGVIMAIVLLLPVTYAISPLASILLLLAAYQGAEYGGSISSIVLGIPGTAAAAATVLDGHEMAKRHSPGKALGYSLTSSTIGGIFGGLVLIFLAVPLAKFALKLTDPEFFLIGILGLLAVGMLSAKDQLNSMISVVLGLMAGTVGMDLFSGSSRFTFGFPELADGIDIIALLVGMFAFSELFDMIGEGLNKRYVTDSRKLKTGITFKEMKETAKPTLFGSLIGAVTGIIPGLGSGAASWFAYSLSRKMSKSPQTFGEGNPDGITAPEAANNAVVGGALVPLLALGIPGSASVAVIMGAFIIHGIQPGPNVLSTHKELVYGIFYGFLLTTIAMYVIGKMVTSAFSRMLSIPNSILIPSILILSLIGIFTSKYMFLNLWIGLGIGVVFFLLKKLDFSLPSFIMAFVLSPIIEESLRRSLVLSYGSYSIFFTRPYSVALVILIAAFLGFAVYSWIRNSKGVKAS